MKNTVYIVSRYITYYKVILCFFFKFLMLIGHLTEVYKIITSGEYTFSRIVDHLIYFKQCLCKTVYPVEVGQTR